MTKWMFGTFVAVVSALSLLATGCGGGKQVTEEPASISTEKDKQETGQKTNLTEEQESAAHAECQREKLSAAVGEEAANEHVSSLFAEFMEGRDQRTVQERLTEEGFVCTQEEIEEAARRLQEEVTQAKGG